ncbi:hypothetical protein KM043_011366 [Ampulex compressa]|nr:hypothetical protein KM043_011366 [Ampulex compressa]
MLDLVYRLKKMGLEEAVALLKWFGVLPNNINIYELLHCNSKEPLITEGNPDYHMSWACSIEHRMGYKFHNRVYLLQAFTHASYTANGMSDERLEFRSDAILVQHGLRTALLAYTPKIHDIIDRFVKLQEQRDHVIDDELIRILLEEEECNMVEHVDVPKIFGDLYESGQ